MVTIIQPYVPLYRVPLFDALAERLGEDGLQLRVAHPAPSGQQAERNDAAFGTWSVGIRSRSLQVAGHDLHLRRCLALARNSDVVIAELASTNLDTFALARFGASRLILWGHGRSYVTSANVIDDALERWLARRAAHLLLYTDGGREYLSSQGVPESKMTVLRNSTDTVALRAEAATLGPAEVAAFRRELGSSPGATAVFVGALDASKGLPLLLAASALVRAKVPNFRLVIAGDGPLRPYVTREARTHPEIVVLPHADRRQLARLGAVGDICLMPGRVGLLAVDAMTLGLPVVTTDWPFHAPERDYLMPAFSWVTPQAPGLYAERIVALLKAPTAIHAASRAAMEASFDYSIEYMAARMYSSIERMRGLRGAA